jgi:hypothetical protein
MSYLPDHYRAVNEESGHAYNCGWGAGADCTCGYYNVKAGHARNCSWGDPEHYAESCSCGKVTLPYWAVTVDLGGERFAVKVSEDFDTCAAAAPGFAKSGSKKVKLTKLSTFEDLNQAEFQLERVRDWESDAEA